MSSGDTAHLLSEWLTLDALNNILTQTQAAPSGIRQYSLSGNGRA